MTNKEMAKLLREILLSTANVAVPAVKMEAFIRAMSVNLAEQLAQRGEVALSGFGSFKVRQRAERNYHNPKTGESITAPARKAVSFTASRAVRERINQ